MEIYGYYSLPESILFYFIFLVGSVILDVIQCVYIAKLVTDWVGWRERESEKRVGIGAPVADVVVALATEWLSTRTSKMSCQAKTSLGEGMKLFFFFLPFTSSSSSAGQA
jgi:hypothetical protein